MIYKARIYIGSLLAGYRQEAGLTIKEAAERAGVSRSNLTNIERGRYSAGVDILTKIAAVYNKKLDFSDINSNYDDFITYLCAVN
jgi:transcriptional regulator with XRE-family HTH domain